jgi:hypothetical protein
LIIKSEEAPKLEPEVARNRSNKRKWTDEEWKAWEEAKRLDKASKDKKDKKWTPRQCWRCSQMAYWGRGHGCMTKGCKAAARPMEIESEKEEGEKECDEGGGQEAAEQFILERADRRRVEEELLEKLDKEKQIAQELDRQLKEATWQELLRQLNGRVGQGEELQGGWQAAGQG